MEGVPTSLLQGISQSYLATGLSPCDICPPVTPAKVALLLLSKTPQDTLGTSEKLLQLRLR